MENVDLDILSLFPQKGARIIGGKGSKQAQRGQQWGEELAQNGCRERRKETPFYRSPRIQPLAAHQPRYYRTTRGTTATGAVLPPYGTTGLSTVPTTAPNQKVCGSRCGSSHGTTARAVLPHRQKQHGQNTHNFSIRTPILMILGLF